MERLVWESYRPTVVVATNRGTDSPVPLLQGRDATDVATAHVCQHLVCGLPITDIDDLAVALER